MFSTLIDAVNMIENKDDKKTDKLKELELYLIFLSKAVRGCGNF